MLRDAAVSAGVPVDLWTLPGGDHNDVVQSSPDARAHLLSRFFAVHLGAAGAE
jgi:hypothetical protein